MFISVVNALFQALEDAANKNDELASRDQRINELQAELLSVKQYQVGDTLISVTVVSSTVVLSFVLAHCHLTIPCKSLT